MMAICVDIQKIQEIDGTYVYQVKKSGQDWCVFYVVLSPQTSTLSFYTDEQLKCLLKVADLKNPHETIGIEGIDPKISGIVMYRCIMALRKNHFPDSMGYYA